MIFTKKGLDDLCADWWAWYMCLSPQELKKIENKIYAAKLKDLLEAL